MKRIILSDISRIFDSLDLLTNYYQLLPIILQIAATIKNFLRRISFPGYSYFMDKFPDLINSIAIFRAIID